MNATAQFRFNYAPADNHDEIVNEFLEAQTRNRPGFQIVDWKIDYQTRYSTCIFLTLEGPVDNEHELFETPTYISPVNNQPVKSQRVV